MRYGLLPVAKHAETFEVRALQIDLLGCVLAAESAEFRRVDLLAHLADFLLDCDFDRQPVAIPARHIGRTQTRHQLRLDDDVLEDLVDGMTEMDHAICVRRTVVQHELCARPDVRF